MFYSTEVPHIFGYQHILYLTVYVVLSAVLLIWLLNPATSERTRAIARKVACIFMLFFVSCGRFSVVKLNLDNGNDTVAQWWRLLPDSFCSLGSFVFAFCAFFLKKDHPALHFITALCFYGGLLNNIYPTYIGDMPSIFYPSTIYGMLHHSVALFLAIYLVATGYVHPTLNYFYTVPLGFCTFVSWGTFLNTIFADQPNFNPMNLREPFVEGTFLEWYVVGAMVVGVHFIVLLLFTLFKKLKTKQA